jgi:hypothetical protein
MHAPPAPYGLHSSPPPVTTRPGATPHARPLARATLASPREPPPPAPAAGKVSATDPAAPSAGRKRMRAARAAPGEPRMLRRAPRVAAAAAQGARSAPPPARRGAHSAAAAPGGGVAGYAQVRTAPRAAPGAAAPRTQRPTHTPPAPPPPRPHPCSDPLPLFRAAAARRPPPAGVHIPGGGAAGRGRDLRGPPGGRPPGGRGGWPRGPRAAPCAAAAAARVCISVVPAAGGAPPGPALHAPPPPRPRPQDLLRRLNLRQAVLAVREPDNPHDPHAVRLEVRAGRERRRRRRLRRGKGQRRRLPALRRPLWQQGACLGRLLQTLSPSETPPPPPAPTPDRGGRAPGLCSAPHHRPVWAGGAPAGRCWGVQRARRAGLRRAGVCESSAPPQTRLHTATTSRHPAPPRQVTTGHVESVGPTHDDPSRLGARVRLWPALPAVTLDLLPPALGAQLDPPKVQRPGAGGFRRG